MIKIRKIFTFAVSFAVILTLSACVRQTTMNIDTFIENLRVAGHTHTSKEDFTSLSKDGQRVYFTELDGYALAVTVSESKAIESVSLISRNIADEGFIKTAKLVSEAAMQGDYDEEKLVLMFKNSPEQDITRESDVGHDFALTLLSGDIGCKYTVSFNEIKPYETTSVPETMNDTYKLVEETTAVQN